MKVKISLFLILMFSLVITTSTYAEKAKVSGSASVDIMSNYVWRGIKLSNSDVVQPSIGITYDNFGANLWVNWDSDWSDSGEHTETDLTLNYSFSINRFGFEIGYIYYALEGTPNDTQEIYASGSYDTLLNPALTIYYDFEEGNGAFVIASISHSLEFSEGIALNLSASASYNIENSVMGTDADGNEFSDFYNGEISASIGIPVTDEISLEPVISYSFPLSDDTEDAIEAFSDDGDSDVIYGGINITLSF
jgi:hypothetical protein